MVGGFAKSGASLENIYNPPGMFWAAVIGGLVLAGAVAGGKAPQAQSEHQQGALRHPPADEKALQACHDALDVPENAAEVDVLAMHYRQRDGEIKPVKSGGEFSNTPVYMWRKGDASASRTPASGWRSHFPA